jgi:hypothetical protein
MVVVVACITLVFQNLLLGLGNNETVNTAYLWTDNYQKALLQIII